MLLLLPPTVSAAGSRALSGCSSGGAGRGATWGDREGCDVGLVASGGGGEVGGDLMQEERRGGGGRGPEQLAWSPVAQTTVQQQWGVPLPKPPLVLPSRAVAAADGRVARPDLKFREAASRSLSQPGPPEQRLQSFQIVWCGKQRRSVADGEARRACRLQACMQRSGGGGAQRGGCSHGW